MTDPNRTGQRHYENGTYINWDAINAMTEEEAAQMWDGLCETFAPHLLKKEPKDGSSQDVVPPDAGADVVPRG